MANPSIDDAVAAVLAGNREAFAAIVAEHAHKVRIVAAAILPDRTEVDDVVQETFVIAFDKLRDYRPGSDFVAWIKAITRNAALNERRRLVRQDRARAAYRERIENACEPHLLAGADEAAVVGLRECLAQLGATAADVIDRLYFHRQPAEQIAAAHARTSAWVWVTLHRTRALLAQCLRGKGFLNG